MGETRRNLFNWQMSAPDESVLVSDGKTLWFYNPFLLSRLPPPAERCHTKYPFMLITRNDPLTGSGTW